MSIDVHLRYLKIQNQSVNSRNLSQKIDKRIKLKSNMKKSFLVLSFLSFILFSCGENSKNTSDANDKNAVVDTLSSIAISTPQAFVDYFTDLRKKAHAGAADFKISSENVFTKNDFYILNFSETIQDYHYNYAIAMHSCSVQDTFSNADAVYLDIQDVLQRLGVSFNLFIGNLKSSSDFTNDGSTDFLLIEQRNFKTNYTETSSILLYDGNKKLTAAPVLAKSDYTAGECSDFIGVMEQLKISNEKFPVATVSRQENISSAGNCNDITHLSYEKKYRWENGKWNDEPHLNTPQLKSSAAFQNFPKKFTLLTKEGSNYVVMENCQNGGPNNYELKLNNPSPLSNYFVLDETEDNVETYFLAGFEQEDAITFILYWRPSNTLDTPNDFASIENAHSVNKVTVKRDPDYQDRYWFYFTEKPDLFTSNFGNYPFVKCNN